MRKEKKSNTREDESEASAPAEEQTVPASAETPADDLPPTFVEHIAAASRDYVSEMEGVTQETRDALRQEEKRLRGFVDGALQSVRDAEANAAKAHGAYLEALELSACGQLPGSHESVRRAYEVYVEAYKAAQDAARDAEHDIGDYQAQYRAAEEAARQTAQKRFAKALHTFTRAQRDVWTSVEPDDVDAHSLIAAAQQIYAVAATATAAGA